MIAFGAPWLLLALPAAALPLLLHLRQRREPPEVAFPAVRYLEDVTRDHRRRVRLQHLLLLLVRTLLLLALVLAAARMRLTGGLVGGHAPTALVLVVDNSASSGVVVDGEPLLARLTAAATAVLARATPGDRLWLQTAEGPAIPGTAAQLRERLARLQPTGGRLDLGSAVRGGRDLVTQAALPGEVVVVSDAQRSAVSAAPGEIPVLLLRPTAAPPVNRRLERIAVDAQPWGVEGGTATITALAGDSLPIPATLTTAGRPPRDLLLLPGVPASERIAGLAPGWWTLRVELPPDEFRADDGREVSVRVAAPPSVRWEASDRFVHAALSVLVADRRVTAGTGVTVGELGPGPAIVLPPDDAARLGALNRRLAARGVAWRYGGSLRAEERSDSGALLPSREAVFRRVRLEPVGGGGDVLATVGGEPWVVRSGNVILVGSRFAPEWTAVPLGTGLVPLLDALLRQAIRGERLLDPVVVGEPYRLPDRVTAVAHHEGRLPVEGGASWRPPGPGVYHLLAGEDTLGAVSAFLDPRESDLTRVPDEVLGTLWGRAAVLGLDEGPARAFTAGGRGDLRGALLLLALLCVVAEAALARRADQRT